MSYENPQKIVNRGFEVLSKSIQTRNNMYAQSLANLGKAVAYNKKRQDQILQANQLQTDKFAFKLDSIEEAQSADQFGNNLKMYFDTQVDEYFDTKNKISRGEIDKREGQRKLNQMEQQVAKFKVMLPEIFKLAKEVKDDKGKSYKTQGGISSTTPTSVLDIMSEIGGKGNVNLVEDPKSGALFLTKLNEDQFKRADKDGDEKLSEDEKYSAYNTQNQFDKGTASGITEPAGSLLNLDEMMKLGPSNMIKRVPKTDKITMGMFDAFSKSDDLNSPYFTYSFVDDEISSADGNGVTNVEKTYRTLNLAQIGKLKNDMTSANTFNSLLNDEEAMMSIWQDTLDHDEPWTNDAAQRTAARKGLVDISVNNGLMKTGLIKTKENDQGNMVPDLDSSGNVQLKEFDDENGQFMDQRSKDEVKITERQQYEMDTYGGQIESTYNSFMEKDKPNLKDVRVMLNEIAGIDPDTNARFTMSTDGKTIIDKGTNPYRSIGGLFKDGKLNEKALIKRIAMVTGLDSKTADQYLRKRDKTKLPG